MDTRSKILTLAAAQELQVPGLAVATGYFDPLVAAHARELQQFRDRTGVGALLVAVFPHEPELLPQRARAELAAALRMVDYVVTADYEDLDRLIERLKPLELLRLEAADALRGSQLREHVQRRQTG